MTAATDQVRDFIVLTTQALQNRGRVVDLQTLAAGLLRLPLGADEAGRADQMSDLERNNPVQFFFLNQLVALVRAQLPPTGATESSAPPASPPPETPGPARRGRRPAGPAAESVG